MTAAASLGAALLLAIGGAPAGARDRAGAGAEVALRVGDAVFTRGDLRARAEILRITQDAGDRADLGAYAQLVEAAATAQVLEALGRPVTPAQLDEEVARIDRSTRAPERLAQVKEVCGGEATVRYRRLFVLPELAGRRWAFEVFPALPAEPGRGGARPAADEVLWRRARDLPVWFADAAVRERFRREVSWAARVRLMPGPPPRR